MTAVPSGSKSGSWIVTTHLVNIRLNSALDVAKTAQRTATQSNAQKTTHNLGLGLKSEPIMNTVCICSSWSQFYFDIGRPVELWLSTSTQVASLLGDIGIRTCLRSDKEWHGLYGLDWRLDGGLGDSAVFSLGCKSWLAFLHSQSLADVSLWWFTAYFIDI